MPDRTPGVPLGREARALVQSLRVHGADPDCVPPLDDAEARKEWHQARSLPARNMPLWVADLAAAVAQQIPERQDRPRGRPRDGATEQVEFLQIGGGSVAKDAKLVETLRARQAEKSADNENPTDVERKAKQDLINVTKEQRAENLARRVYKRRGKQRKGDVPKSD